MRKEENCNRQRMKQPVRLWKKWNTQNFSPWKVGDKVWLEATNLRFNYHSSCYLSHCLTRHHSHPSLLSPTFQSPSIQMPYLPTSPTYEPSHSPPPSSQPILIYSLPTSCIHALYIAKSMILWDSIIWHCLTLPMIESLSRSSFWWSIQASLICTGWGGRA